MTGPTPPDLRTAWSQRQQAFGNSPRAVLLKGLHPRINDLIDAWHRVVLHAAFDGRAAERPTLDIGCGYGRLAGEARAIGLDPVVGIDFAPGFCAQFQAQHGPAVCGDLARLPFVDASFGNAYSVTALMYLSEDAARAALQSLDRCLASGGHVLVLEPGAEFNTLARSLLRAKRGGDMTQPGFPARVFDAGLAPAGWQRVACGSSIGLTLALPLLVLLARWSGAFGAIARLVARIDRPRAGARRGWLARFALYRWSLYRKP